jgi:hypothetical protein
MTKILGLFLLVFSSTSFSSDWKEFSKTDSDKFYIDKESISKIDSDNYTYWILRSSLDTNEKIRSVKTKDVMNCKKREYRITYMIQYSGPMGRGNTIREGNISETFTPVRPDTMEEDIFKSICKKTFPFNKF